VKLIVDLAETPETQAAVDELLEWYNSIENHLSAAGNSIEIYGAKHVFHWRIVGLEKGNE